MSFSNNFILKMRRYMFLAPLLSLPIMCTLETGILLYILTSSAVNFLILYTLNSPKFKELVGIPEYLPGTKLERMVRVTKLIYRMLLKADIPPQLT